jgi:hypothetical protein
MGVLTPRLRTLDGKLLPPSTRAEIFRNIFLINFLAKSGNSNPVYFFLVAHAKIWNPTTTPSVVLNSGGNKKKKKKKKD